MAIYPKGYDVNSFVSSSGERFREEYVGEKDEKGFINLVSTGRTDLQEMYNEAAEGCDINVIVARFNNGDPTALFARQGSYGDIVGAPKNLMEAYQLINDARNAFNSLTDEKKAAFGSFKEFVSTAGAASWFEKMKDNVVEQKVEVVDNAEHE